LIPADAVTVWRFVDGKPGHDRQSAGLVRALQEHRPCATHTCSVGPAARVLVDLLLGRSPVTDAVPRPDIAVGAGHATHLSLLAARRATGCAAIVLMKPGLPLGWFDLCLVPRHDHVGSSDHVVETEGAINPIIHTPEKTPDTGMMLLGGPSKHYDWDCEAMLSQIRSVLEKNAASHWQITSSRRTPAEFMTGLATLAGERVRLAPHTECPPGWLDRELPHQEQVWVSPDSVSMVYEAISAGARVGLFDLPAQQADKITRAIDELCAAGMATPFSLWREGRVLSTPPRILNEADRCAAIISDRFLTPHLL